jgi:hypothetical protein
LSPELRNGRGIKEHQIHLPDTAGFADSAMHEAARHRRRLHAGSDSGGEHRVLGHSTADGGIELAAQHTGTEGVIGEFRDSIAREKICLKMPAASSGGGRKTRTG